MEKTELEKIYEETVIKNYTSIPLKDLILRAMREAIELSQSKQEKPLTIEKIEEIAFDKLWYQMANAHGKKDEFRKAIKDLSILIHSEMQPKQACTNEELKLEIKSQLGLSEKEQEVVDSIFENYPKQVEVSEEDIKECIDNLGIRLSDRDIVIGKIKSNWSKEQNKVDELFAENTELVTKNEWLKKELELKDNTLKTILEYGNTGEDALEIKAIVRKHFNN